MPQFAGFFTHKLALGANEGDKRSMILRRFLAAFMAFSAVLAAALPALADPADIEASARGVVRVILIGRAGDEIFVISHGTGFSVGNERIVTNAHVINEAIDNSRVSIGLVPADGGDAVYARLVSVSPRNDLALLQSTTPMRLAPLTIAANPATQAGAATAIGYPANVDLAQGLDETDMFRPQPPVTSTGFLSGRRPSREFDTLLHTAPIGRGNSGGPLVDDCGRVIGVNSFGAESEGTDAEFFFAISNRELLPFLRANGVTPRINGLPCRSISELDAAQAAREERERAAEEGQRQAQAQREAQRAEELRRSIMYEVFDARGNRQFLALFALVIMIAAAGFAWNAHERSDHRARGIAGAIALAALVAALAAWLTRPSFTDIETRLEEKLREEDGAEAEGDSGIIAAPSPTSNGDGANLTCILDLERSRVIGAAEEDVPLQWRDDGCVNGRTQYGLAAGTEGVSQAGSWTRVLVPADEAAVSVNRFDPEAREYTVERYLLDRETISNAREARGTYEAPACNAGEAAARALGSAQASIIASLPDSPNERLVYRCVPGDDQSVE